MITTTRTTANEGSEVTRTRTAKTIETTQPRTRTCSKLHARHPDGKKQDLFSVDYHFHIWNAAKENWLRPDLAKGWINCFYDYTKALSPKEYVWDWDTYAYYGEEKALKDVFGDGHVDMAIFEPQ